MILVGPPVDYGWVLYAGNLKVAPPTTDRAPSSTHREATQQHDFKCATRFCSVVLQRLTELASEGTTGRPVLVMVGTADQFCSLQSFEWCARMQREGDAIARSFDGETKRRALRSRWTARCNSCSLAFASHLRTR